MQYDGNWVKFYFLHGTEVSAILADVCLDSAAMVTLFDPLKIPIIYANSPTQLVKYDVHTTRKIKSIHAIFYHILLLLYLTGDFIDNIHRRWSNDYKKLERDHAYIQWLVEFTEHSLCIFGFAQAVSQTSYSYSAMQ